MNWFMSAFKKYAVFTGRSRRKEYWFFVLFAYLITFALALTDFAIGTYDVERQIGLLSGIAGFIFIIPQIAVAIRRLHDTDRTGWWLLIVLIPIIGAIWLLVLMVLDGTAGPNQYGEDPKDW